METGDIVQLKSGGPNMTVDGFLSEADGKNFQKGYQIMLNRKTDSNKNPFAVCKWFDNQSAYKIDIFRQIILEVKQV